MLHRADSVQFKIFQLCWVRVSFVNIKEIEDKIKGIVSKEALKSAKILYLASAVVFSYLDKNTIIIIIRDKNNILNDIKIYDIDSFINDHVQNGFNSVDIVALFYFYEFYNERINSYLLPEQNGFENSENLLGHNLVIKNKGANKLPSLLKPESDFLVPQAKLIINSSKSFPYSSSTWESCSISIELRYRGRSYIGNSNKLRQLRFDDGKASLVKMSDFFFSR